MHDVPKKEELGGQADVEAAHKAAFENLCEHVNASIVSGVGGTWRECRCFENGILPPFCIITLSAIILITKLINLNQN